MSEHESNTLEEVEEEDDLAKDPRHRDDDVFPRPPPPQRTGGNGQEKTPSVQHEEDLEEEERNGLSTFARDSTRRSLANNAAMLKWLEAQERQQDRANDEVCLNKPKLSHVTFYHRLI